MKRAELPLWGTSSRYLRTCADMVRVLPTRSVRTQDMWWSLICLSTWLVRGQWTQTREYSTLYSWNELVRWCGCVYVAYSSLPWVDLYGIFRHQTPSGSLKRCCREEKYHYIDWKTRPNGSWISLPSNAMQCKDMIWIWWSVRINSSTVQVRRGEEDGDGVPSTVCRPALHCTTTEFQLPAEYRHRNISLRISLHCTAPNLQDICIDSTSGSCFINPLSDLPEQ